MNRYYGLKVVSAKKTKIIDGIDALKNWRIFSHPRCKKSTREFALYSWRTNQNSDTLPIPEDRNNHCIDAIRYATGTAINVPGTDYKILNTRW